MLSDDRLKEIRRIAELLRLGWGPEHRNPQVRGSEAIVELLEEIKELRRALDEARENADFWSGEAHATLANLAERVMALEIKETAPED